MHLVGFITKEICYDARSHERKRLGYWLDVLGMVVICMPGAKESLLFLLLRAQIIFGPTHPFIQSLNRGNLSLGVRRPVREAEH